MLSHRDGVVGRAVERGGLQVDCYDPRDYATDVHRTVDDRSYGGGPGMVLKVEPLRSALRSARAALPQGSRRVYLGADGLRFEQGLARGAREWPGLGLETGRCEGVGERLLARETHPQWVNGQYVVPDGAQPGKSATVAISRYRLGRHALRGCRAAHRVGTPDDGSSTAAVAWVPAPAGGARGAGAMEPVGGVGRAGRRDATRRAGGHR